MTRLHRTIVSIAAVVMLAACAHQIESMGSAAPKPMQMSASVPVMQGGYKKVASAPGAELYFINIKNGDVLSNPVRVQFGLRGMGIAPAGIEKENTGHHHLLIDVDSLDSNGSIPADDKHRHFGLGQTEVSLEMKPGVHTLQLILGDQNHIPHHPPVVSQRISVTV